MKKTQGSYWRAPAGKSDRKYRAAGAFLHPKRYMHRYLRQFVPGLEFSTATR